MKWFEKAAEQGIAQSQAKMGEAYGRGDGVAKNTTTSFEWYQKAAAQGYAPAQYNLCIYYSKGEVIKDDVKAHEWCQRSAEQGHVLAFSALGVSYAEGRGVPKDLVKAYMWYSIAEVEGDQRAKQSRMVIKPVMTVSEVAEAKKLSKICFKNKFKDCG